MMESLPVPKGRLLCTEDDLDTREMLILLLQEAGYEVECTESPENAIALVKEQFFDLILVDNWMPGMGGNEVTREIRKFNLSTPFFSILPPPMNLISNQPAMLERRAI